MSTGFAPRPSVAASPPWAFPESTSWQLPNGLRGHHIEVAGRGLFTVSAQVRAPLSGEPAGQDGITALLVACLEEGTDSRDATQSAEYLDDLGADFESGLTWAGPAVGMSLPASRAEAGLALLAETMSRPAFAPDAVERVRAQHLDYWNGAMADAEARATVEFFRGCFTAETRMSRPPGGTGESIQGIERDALAAHWTRIAHPSNITLITAGDLPLERVEELAGQYFGGWADGEHTVSQPQEPEAAVCTVRLVDRPGSVQSALLLGAPTVDARHVDFCDLLVATHVLGGSMGSRLSSVIREEKGYTYGISARITPSVRGGMFIVDTTVAAEVTVPALSEIRRILAEFRAHGLTAAECEDAVHHLNGGEPLSYETTGSLAHEMGREVAMGMPVGWINARRRRIAETTAAGATAAFTSLIPESLHMVIVGDAARLQAELVVAGFEDIQIIEA
ncbi:pitrilysin family protein [Streptomyces sp. NPDC005811]|uniref:M16 family metallopeptidase n=1 Tax=Streptomyces sp. NPDC005811 TaxID=3154565 RepID=UPI0033F4725F